MSIRKHGGPAGIAVVVAAAACVASPLTAARTMGHRADARNAVNLVKRNALEGMEDRMPLPA